MKARYYEHMRFGDLTNQMVQTFVPLMKTCVLDAYLKDLETKNVDYVKLVNDEAPMPLLASGFCEASARTMDHPGKQQLMSPTSSQHSCGR